MDKGFELAAWQFSVDHCPFRYILSGVLTPVLNSFPVPAFLSGILSFSKEIMPDFLLLNASKNQENNALLLAAFLLSIS